jgi:hypothetical protein
MYSNDHVRWYVQTKLLCVRNDAERCTVLDAPARVLEFGLAVDMVATTF